MMFKPQDTVLQFGDTKTIQVLILFPGQAFPCLSRVLAVHTGYPLPSEIYHPESLPKPSADSPTTLLVLLGYNIDWYQWWLCYDITNVLVAHQIKGIREEKRWHTYKRIDEETRASPSTGPPYYSFCHYRSMASAIRIMLWTFRFGSVITIRTGTFNHLVPWHGRLGNGSLQ